MDKGVYKGVPLSALRIEAVVWTEDRAEHIRSRTIRYGDGEVDLEPAWAGEAVMDPDRIIAVAGDKGGDVVNKGRRIFTFSRASFEGLDLVRRSGSIGDVERWIGELGERRGSSALRTHEVTGRETGSSPRDGRGHRAGRSAR